MVVLSVTNCPLQLRGDLTKWFIEIDIGVYVGKISTRVREKIWLRVCDNIKTGKAIMVYSTNSEQGFAILTHNTEWTPVDCEGIWLMQKNNPIVAPQQILPKGFSKAAKYAHTKSNKKVSKKQYVIIDLETTGLNYETDRIIEIGMLKIEENCVIDQYQSFVYQTINIPPEIVAMTGITSEMISESSISELEALQKLKTFIENCTVVGYNIDFDINFINHMCDRLSFNTFIFRCKDMLKSIRRKLHLDNYKLETVARACSIEISNLHRALTDCELIYRINNELNIF